VKRTPARASLGPRRFFESLPVTPSANAVFQSRAIRRIVGLACVSMAMSACPPLPTGHDPRVDDPCYSPTLWVDTLSMQVDSVSWQWTPGMCD